MRYLKTYKIFESIDNTKEMVENFLRDGFSDIDIPVQVEMYQPDPLGSQEMRVLILIEMKTIWNNPKTCHFMRI